LFWGGFLSDKAPRLRLAIHRDRDFLDEVSCDNFESQLKKSNICSLLTEGNDIESYFLSPEHLHTLNPQISVERIQALIEQATDEMKDKSITALVNLRIEQAFKQRRVGGEQPNFGEISIRAHGDYESNLAEYRRGKFVLGRLIALMQQEIGQNPRVFISSEHLKFRRISEVAKSIWPSGVL
jgi:hypothetical protein